MCKGKRKKSLNSVIVKGIQIKATALCNFSPLIHTSLLNQWFGRFFSYYLCLYGLTSCNMKMNYFQQLKRRTGFILGGVGILLEFGFLFIQQLLLYTCNVQGALSNQVWYKDAHYWDWEAMVPETLTSAPVVSMTHQNQVPSHLTGHLAHWQQSPSTCSLPYYLVPLFIQDESLGPPFIQEVFLAIPMPQTPVETPGLCLYSSQWAGMEVGGTFSILYFQHLT